MLHICSLVLSSQWINKRTRIQKVGRKPAFWSYSFFVPWTSGTAERTSCFGLEITSQFSDEPIELSAATARNLNKIPFLLPLPRGALQQRLQYSQTRRGRFADPSLLGTPILVQTTFRCSYYKIDLSRTQTVKVI